MPRKPTLVDRVMNEPIEYGGEVWPRWKVMDDLYRVARSNGHDHQTACRLRDLYMMGRLQAQHAKGKDR